MTEYLHGGTELRMTPLANEDGVRVQMRLLRFRGQAMEEVHGMQTDPFATLEEAAVEMKALIGAMPPRYQTAARLELGRVRRSGGGGRAGPA